jgi:hypothetical protein
MENLKKINLVFILSLFSFSAFSGTAMGKRRFSIDSQFFTLSEKSSIPSNRAIGDFTVDFIDGTGWIFDKTAELTHANKSAWSRLPYLLLMESVLFMYVTEPLGLAYHEMGHASRIRALGGRPHYSYKNSPEKYSNFFSFALAGMGEEIQDATVEPKAGSVFTLSNANYQIYSGMGELKNPFYLMGGVNNEMLLAEKLENKMAQRSGHVMEVANYVMAKMSTFFYIDSSPTVGDIVAIKSFYALGNNIVSDDDLKLASQLSLLFSSSTYAYLYGIYNFVANNESRVEHFSYKGFRLPDLSFYLMKRGLSYKLRSGYEFENKKTNLVFEVEHVYKGKKATEISLGIDQSMNFKNKNLKAKLISRIGPGVSTTLETDLEITKNLWLGLGVNQFNLYSLWGERHISSLENEKTTHIDLYSTLNYYY